MPSRGRVDAERLAEKIKLLNANRSKDVASKTEKSNADRLAQRQYVLHVCNCGIGSRHYTRECTLCNRDDCPDNILGKRHDRDACTKCYMRNCTIDCHHRFDEHRCDRCGSNRHVTSLCAKTEVFCTYCRDMGRAYHSHSTFACYYLCHDPSCGIKEFHAIGECQVRTTTTKKKIKVQPTVSPTSTPSVEPVAVPSPHIISTRMNNPYDAVVMIEPAPPEMVQIVVPADIAKAFMSFVQMQSQTL
jgi:hypothetical protein